MGQPSAAAYADLSAEARYFDGKTAVPQSVRIRFGTHSLVIEDASGRALAHWPLSSLHALSDRHAAAAQYAPSPEDEERLVVEDELMCRAIDALCPRLRRKPASTRGVRKALTWGVGSLAAVALMVFAILPSLAVQLAAAIPPEREARLGDAVLGQVVGLVSLGGDNPPGFCTAARGRGALDKMVARLEDTVELPYPLRVSVLDVDTVNAFAAPGGRIVLFRGLIDSAASPEEVAGVLAHEIGHVLYRDPTVGVLRAAGTAGILGLLVGDVFGVAIVVAASEAVLSASYQREAEARADETAFDILAEAGLPSDPFAGFFLRLAERYGASQGVMEYLSSHPALGTRAERAAAADDNRPASFRPVLSDREWIALRNICTQSAAEPDT